MPFATIGSAIWGFLKRIPDWVIWLLAAIIFLKFVDMRAERRGRDAANAKNERDSLKERAAIKDAGTKAIEDIHDAQDAARVAPDRLPEFTSADQLRRDEAAISGVILRPSRVEHGGGS